MVKFMMNKTLISLAVASILPLAASTAHAVLAPNAVLNFNPGVVTTSLYGASLVKTGSYFGMDTSGNGAITANERTALVQHDGLFLGLTQAASGSHTGAPGSSANESPGIDAAWAFFGNTGLDYTAANKPATVLSTPATNTATIDMSGWTVTWNGIASIPMGSGAWQTTPANPESVAVVTCAVDCGTGDTYTLDYSATVPLGDPSGFGGVKYNLRLDGTVGVCGAGDDAAAPTATNDSYPEVIQSTATPLTILANDTDTGCAGLDKTSVDLGPTTTGKQTSITTANGSATVDAFTGVVTYTPATGYLGPDSFTYTVKDRNTNISTTASVDITVIKPIPVCNNDGVPQGAFIDTTKNTSVIINVLNNDTSPVYPIDTATVTVTSQPSNGLASANSDGTITYTPNLGYTGTDPFTYLVSDNEASPNTQTCADATVSVLVTQAGTPIGGVANGYLQINTGLVGSNIYVQPALGQGSWFSMEVKPGQFTYTALAGFNGIKLGATQPASASSPNIDNAWTFFGNQGVDQTSSDTTQLSNDGSGNATINFSGWDVSWNGIPSIPMGNGQDNGIATLTCYTDLVAGTPGDCAVPGTQYVLSYRAIVPVGDPSGFGGVNYALHLEGVIATTPPILGCNVGSTPADVADVSSIDNCASPSALAFSPGATATAVGNATGISLTAAQIGQNDSKLNPKDGQMCVGGCLDFVVSNITTDHINVVAKLNAPIPSGAVYRKLINGHWTNFDISGSDRIGSKPLDGITGNCQGPQGIYRVGLSAGDQCLFLTIYDGGPNDADGIANGTIVDPSGVLLPGSPNVPASSTNGCSISNTPVSIIERADWMLVAGFIGLIAIVSFARRREDVDS